MKPSHQSGILTARVNTTDSVCFGYETNIGPEALFTDVEDFAAREYWRKKYEANPNDDWARQCFENLRWIKDASDVEWWIKERMPSAIVGRYHSSRYALGPEVTLKQFQQPFINNGDQPPERIPVEHYVSTGKFAESELLPRQYDHPGGMRIVDFRQPATRAKLVALIVDDALKAGASALMTDEWSPSATWEGEPWFQYVLALEKQLTESLHRHNIEHWPNMHFRIGGKNDFDDSGAPRLDEKQIYALAKNCDCLPLERPCDKEAKPQDILTDYKTIALIGTPCVFMGDPSMTPYLAMLTATNDGALNYVSHAVTEPEPDWKYLPARLGKPLKFIDGKVTWQGNVASRRFEHGEVWLDFDKREGGIR